MSLERHQRSHRHIHRPQFRRTPEVRQVDDEAGRDHIGADLAQQLHRSLRGAAGGDQVVDQDHALAGMNGVGVHLHFIEAVFQRVGDAHGGMRQLAPLADRHEAGGDLMRYRAAENEAARLDARDLVDLVARPWLHQFIDRAAEGARVAEQRRDVAKQYPRLRIIRNGADGGLQIVFKSHRCLFQVTVRKLQLTGTPSRNAFSTMRRPTSPPSDISDSGWNCTPPTGKVLCSIAMATPSSVLAVTWSTSGMLSRST